MIPRLRSPSPWLAAILALILPIAPLRADDAPQPAHGASMYGDLKYGPDFTHFDYANPDAPKGGTLTLPAIGSFDNLNQFILKGNNADGLGLLYDTLTAGSLDEPFSEYGLIAESITIPKDRSFVIFTLRPEARWQDGTPITVDDVIWTVDTLKTKGHPFYRAYYANIVKAEKVGEHQVKMIFDGKTNRELPLIAGQMPVLPKHYYEKVEFDKTTLTPPLGSGPYRINGSTPAAPSSTSAIPTTGGPSCRSTSAATTSTRSATNTIATRTSRWRRSRPATTTCRSRTTPRTGRPPTPARPSRRS